MRPKVTRSMLSTRLEQEIALSVGLPPPSQNRTLLPMQLTSQTKLLQSVSRGEEQHPPFRGSLRLRLRIAFYGDRVFTFSSLLACPRIVMLLKASGIDHERFDASAAQCIHFGDIPKESSRSNV